MSAERPARQLPLDFPVRPSFAPEDFLVGASNKAALDIVERWPDWPDPVLVLAGPEGSGKSHLAAMWAARAGGRVLPAGAIGSEAVPDLAGYPALVVEDADRGLTDEAGLFHLINARRGGGLPLLLTARGAPDRWGLTTADLLSRLRLAPLVEIGAPDDSLLRAVLVKLFLDRQLVVDTGVIDYLATRAERSLAAARAIVEALDREALSHGRRPTRALAAGLLASMEPTEEESDPG